MKRRKTRELVIKALFAYEMEKGDPFRQLSYIAEDWEMAGFTEGKREAFLSAIEDEYARRLTAGVLDNKEKLDEMITAYAVDWEISRLGGAERNILRMSFYEMLYDEKLAPAIVINEAVDMIKKYGTPEAARFVNGVLGSYAELLKKEKAAGDGAAQDAPA